jgi:hypothetical protein
VSLLAVCCCGSADGALVLLTHRTDASQIREQSGLESLLRRLQGVLHQDGDGHRTDAARHGRDPAGALARDLDDEAFHDAFTSRLATTLNLPATPASWPDLDESITALAEQYGTSEWIDYR